MFYWIHTYSLDNKVAISELIRTKAIRNSSFIEQVAVAKSLIDNFDNYRKSSNDHFKKVEFEDDETALLWFKLNY